MALCKICSSSTSEEVDALRAEGVGSRLGAMDRRLHKLLGKQQETLKLALIYQEQAGDQNEPYFSSSCRSYYHHISKSQQET